MEVKVTEHFYNSKVVKVEACREVRKENDQKTDDGFNNNDHRTLFCSVLSEHPEVWLRVETCMGP